jgi:protein-S-isoprenylcysteine O-methyltransferase Ste14
VSAPEREGTSAASPRASDEAPARPDFGVAAGRFFFAHRNYLFPLVFVATALISPPRPWLGRPSADVWLDALGLAVAAAGQAVRGLVIGLAYVPRGGKDRKVHADELVQQGLFVHCRNPLYVGNLLVYFGLFLILNSPGGWLVGFPFFVLAYVAIVRAEEDFLRGRFGAAYEEYCRRVPRFVPSLRGIGATLRSTRFDGKRVIRKEYGQFFAWPTAALALFAEQSVVWRGQPGVWASLRGVIVAWAVLLVAYAFTRYLKKTRRLDDHS